jgi:hypothetical protein
VQRSGRRSSIKGHKVLIGLFTAFFTSALAFLVFAWVGIPGLCKGDECNFIFFIVTPLLTLITWPYWTTWVKRRSEGTRFIMATVIFSATLALIAPPLILAVFAWAVIKIVIAIRKLRAASLPIGVLFLSPTDAPRKLFL